MTSNAFNRHRLLRKAHYLDKGSCAAGHTAKLGGKLQGTVGGVNDGKESLC